MYILNIQGPFVICVLKDAHGNVLAPMANWLSVANMMCIQQDDIIDHAKVITVSCITHRAT